MECERTGWRYDQFEASFLAFVQEIDLEDIVRDHAETKKYTNLQNEIESTRGKLAIIMEKIDRLVELFATAGGAADIVGQKLNELEQQRTALEETIRQKENKYVALKSDLAEFYASKEQIKTLIRKINGHGTYKLRAEISSRIKSLISTLIIAPAGQRYFCVGFKDGSALGVYPSDNEPLQFDKIFGFKDVKPELLSNRWLKKHLTI